MEEISIQSDKPRNSIELQVLVTKSPIGPEESRSLSNGVDGVDHDGEKVPASSEKQSLIRNLTLFDALSMFAGVIIGSGIFASPGTSLDRVNGHTIIWLSTWVLAGGLSLLGSLVYAELSAAFPTSGGAYFFLTKAFGRWAGFVYAFSEFLVQKAGSQAILSIIFARYFGSVVFDWDLEDKTLDASWQIKFLALATLSSLTAFNMAGAHLAALLQRFLSMTKFVAMGLVLLMGIYTLTFVSTDTFTQNFRSSSNTTIPNNNNNNNNGTDGINNNTTGASISGIHPFENSLDMVRSIGAAMIACLWAYDGYSGLSMIAEEVQNPRRNIPLALILGMLIVIGCFVLTLLSYLCVLTAEEIASSQVIAISMGVRVLGEGVGRYIMAILIGCSVFGTLNGSIYTGARTLFAAARDENFLFPNLVQKVNRRGSPYLAVLTQSIWSAALIIPSNFEALVQYFGFIAYIFYSAVALALIVMRKRELEPMTSFKVRPFPLVPILFILISATMVITSFSKSIGPSLIAILLELLCVPIYFLFFNPGTKWSDLYNRFMKQKSPGSNTIAETETFAIDEDA